MIKNERPTNASGDAYLIETALLNYHRDHAQHLPSARKEEFNLSLWSEFWSGRTVSEITPAEQRKFREWLAKAGTRGKSTIDKILSSGRAALNQAVANGELVSTPKIKLIETKEEMRARPPMGRPITSAETAKLLDSIQSRHLFMFALIAANTLARPDAIMDLSRAQFDEGHNLLNLNPAGRRQTKKHRPTIPVTPTLQPWLARVTDLGARFIAVRGKSVQSIYNGWNSARRSAGVDDEVTPYSFRHGMAREMRKRGVPIEEISLFLGHLPRGSTATTSIYAPFEPQYCTKAVAAIEEVMDEVRGRMTRYNIDDLPGTLAYLDQPRPQRQLRQMPENMIAELRSMIKEGVAIREIARRYGVCIMTVHRWIKRFPDFSK